MTWGHICIIPVNPSTLNLETQSSIGPVIYQVSTCLYKYQYQVLCLPHTRQKSASDLLTTSNILVWQFWKVPNTSTCQAWKEKQKTTHTMTSLWYVQKYIPLQHGSRLQTERQELSIHVEHTGGGNALPIPCCQGETIVSYSCLELQSSEFRHHIWCIFSQGQLFTFLQKILSIQSKIFA
jgi:hypothetical protein